MSQSWVPLPLTILLPWGGHFLLSAERPCPCAIWEASWQKVPGTPALSGEALISPPGERQALRTSLFPTAPTKMPVFGATQGWCPSGCPRRPAWGREVVQRWQRRAVWSLGLCDAKKNGRDSAAAMSAVLVVLGGSRASPSMPDSRRWPW